jgi:SAM-dependent methyltransferase
LQPVRRDDLPLLNYQAGYGLCYGAGAPEKPRILVAGCGTIEPVAVAMANPKADILAVDISEASLKRLRWQARARGVNIRTLHSDIEALEERDFDYIIATGVLHHLEDPARGLRALVERSRGKAVFRFMLYSRFGRELLYGAKELGRLLGIKEPKAFRKMIASLPASHPYRVYFHLYGDAATDTGVCDGYLHPCDQPFDALTLRDFLKQAGLEVGGFLHKPSGQATSWEELAVKESLAQLEENFCFFAGFPAEKKEGILVWNPALPAKGKFFSRLLGEEIGFDRSAPVADQGRLARALFLLPEGE